MRRKKHLLSIYRQQVFSLSKMKRISTQIIETHGKDNRWTCPQDNIVPTLNAAMGTGGGNVPMVLEYYCEDDEIDSSE